MMNIRQRSVNVNRNELLTKLKENLELHQSEYQEALVECHARLVADLKKAVQYVENLEDLEKLKEFNFNFQFPHNHEREYKEVIEMLEMSVDTVINLDAESFRAYIKNQWSWSANFAATKSLYATEGAFLG